MFIGWYILIYLSCCSFLTILLQFQFIYFTYPVLLYNVSVVVAVLLFTLSAPFYHTYTLSFSTIMTVDTTKSDGSQALPILPTYSTVACIGAGLAAIALGAQLKRWYGFEDIQFFERHPTSSGTWWVNSYPGKFISSFHPLLSYLPLLACSLRNFKTLMNNIGCACDVPSALYSFSFEQNPNWTKLMPSNDEIREYAQGIAAKYDLPKKMTFNCDVERCDWREDASRWLLQIRNTKTGELFFHECQVLFSATGALVHPREIDIPGSENFAGAIFHAARWDHSVSLKGKDVIVIGNGCKPSIFRTKPSEPN